MGNYWRKRFEMLEKKSNEYGLDAFRQIEPTFIKAEKEIQKEIESWYGRYARNNNITMTEARRQLSTKELKEFRWDVKEYIKYGRENAIDQRWMKQLENASARVHINRLEALKIRTQQAAEVAFGNELNVIDAMARKVYTEDYYHSIFEIQKGFGIGWEIGQVDQRKLSQLISKPWAADGKNFSQRIWNHRDQLVNELHTQMTRTCILGEPPKKAIDTIAKKFNTTKNQAGRLVMTEQAFFHSAAQRDAFKELEVEEFEVVATLDSSTSDICQDMDGQHFPMSEYEPGVTAPPFHVWCRSVTAPYFEDNYGGERVARDADGKTYYVPDDMKYKDWKEYFVDKTKNPADWLKPTNMNVKDVKTSFIPANTIKEAESYAQVHFADNASFKGITNLDAINEINERLTYLMETYPVDKLDNMYANSRLKTADMKANAFNLEFNTKRINENSMGYDWQGRIKRNVKKIEEWKEYLDSTKYSTSTIKAYKKAIKNAEKENMFKRWTFYGDTGKIADIVTHEYGHILADQYFGQMNGKWGNPNFSVDLNNALYKTKIMVNSVYHKARKNGDIYNISMYADSDEYEFFAETFAMYIGGEKLPDYIEEMLKEVLENGRL